MHRDCDAGADRAPTSSQPATRDGEQRAHSDDADVETYPHPEQTFHASGARDVAQAEPVPFQRDGDTDDEGPEHELLREIRQQR